MVNAELRAGHLVSLRLDEPTIEMPGIFAVYPADRHPPAKVRAFIDFLASRFSPVPPWDRAYSS
jgi:DNA-binding transcriptional LysR family regulator